jgi:hypothetical protein
MVASAEAMNASSKFRVILLIQFSSKNQISIRMTLADGLRRLQEQQSRFDVSCRNVHLSQLVGSQCGTSQLKRLL